MIISFLEETIAAAIIGFIVERIIRKTLSYMYKENDEENIHLEFRPQNTQEEIVIIAEREHNKVFKFSNYI
jgi:hypothetical protein